MATIYARAEISCAQCGGMFSVPKKRNWTNHKYCSPECGRTAKEAYRPDYLRAFASRQIARADDGTKVCRVCGDEKQVARFSKSPNFADGRNTVCGQCLKIAAQARWDSKTEDEKEAARAAKRARSQTWKLANKDKVRASTRRTSAKNTERFNRWRSANLERSNFHVRASGYKRRGAKAEGATGAETREWFNAQKKTCHWCGMARLKRPTIDHLTPLSRGGKHEIRNLAIACGACNSRKHAKDPLEFARELGKLL